MNNFNNEFDKELEDRRYVCPICGKRFSLPLWVSKSDYAYKIWEYDPVKKKSLARKCCSYSCFRKGSKD